MSSSKVYISFVTPSKFMPFILFLHVYSKIWHFFSFNTTSALAEESTWVSRLKNKKNKKTKQDDSWIVVWPGLITVFGSCEFQSHVMTTP